MPSGVKTKLQDNNWGVKKAVKNTGLTWRIVLIISLITLMIFVTVRMVSSGSGLIDHGKVDLSSVDFQQSVALNGDWEFYWNRLLTPNDFRAATANHGFAH